jgi:tetratricopeptide (TPR) repeat protein
MSIPGGQVTQRLNERWLDISIRVSIAVIVALGAYLAYMLWVNAGVQAVSSPSSRAVENLRAAVTASPGNPTLRVRLAEGLVFAGRMGEAVDQYNAALKMNKDFVPALSGLATLSMNDKQFPAAVTYWTRIIRLLQSTSPRSPDLEGAYYGLGVTYLETKQYENAVLNLKEALRIRSSVSDTHYMLSIAYRELGYPDKQREELDITLAFDPNNPQANYDAGLILLKEGDIASAAEAFRIAENGAPSSVDLPQQKLDSIAASGTATARVLKAASLEWTEPKVALSEARIAAALDPADIAAVRILARLWEKVGEKDRALKANERILELMPEDTQAAKAIKRLSQDGK